MNSMHQMLFFIPNIPKWIDIYGIKFKFFYVFNNNHLL
ncbi:hypothetical protein LEP1GSC005_1652 [Leptospira santarosai str. ST188]|uniref:Uncharacterized protein n=1 Tax=Leptospira santarosai str. MOR084 TaxID=1049984 RepID=A0A0E2BL74_9LEPT|nr:hypothetical protein LEP1GSC179_2801 [Leptospira santarosai str. MOR084]EKO79880.1 hypothetical protein LEP1GSC068_3459 [Leptospira sp. Fiocruz LV3954]EMF88693.1 hypothetical protein LEP1GSC005_1652 [Leptospira santarosai str. ST188]EMI61613.1 hypothetical protein LEP1GSC076_3542 [Leptospira sp. Fiocruz LV4135]